MQRRPLVWLLSAAMLLLCSGQVSAHYLWILGKTSAEKEGSANIYFEESPSPGDGHYLKHFLGTSNVWIRTLESPQPEPVKAVEVKEGAKRWMRVALPKTKECSVDSYGKFGVYDYGKTKVLLHYYARHLIVGSHDTLHELGRAEQMDLDLAPHDFASKVDVTLLWKGKPVAGRMVFIRGPKGFRKNVKTDEAGRVRIEPKQAGRYTFRSSVEQATPGEEKGEAYDLIRHNITLLMELPLGG